MLFQVVYSEEQTEGTGIEKKLNETLDGIRKGIQNIASDSNKMENLLDNITKGFKQFGAQVEQIVKTTNDKLKVAQEENEKKAK